jgi:hypothetical protein
MLFAKQVRVCVMATKAGKKKAKANPRKKVVPATAASSAKAPRATRPIIPKGYQMTSSPTGLLDWTWARKRLERSHNYVIVTVRPDGRPHAMGMHGIWFDDAYYFGTDETTRKARNLAGNPHCIIINENLGELVIVEGRAEVISFAQLPEGLAAVSKKKYGWAPDPRMGGGIYKVVPQKVFAFPLKQIATAVTRWIFEENQ